VQYSTVKYSTVEYSTVQYSTVQYSIVEYSTVKYSTVQYSTVYIYTHTVHKTTQLATEHTERNVHKIYTQNDTKQTIRRTTQQFGKSAGRARSWLVIPWHLPYS